MAPRAPTAAKWIHPSGVPLSDIVVGDVVDGTVTKVVTHGLFVDIGAVKDGLVRAQGRSLRGFRRGMHLRGLSVVACDLEAEKIHLEAPDLEGPPTAGGRSEREGFGGGSRGGGGSGNRAVSVPALADNMAPQRRSLPRSARSMTPRPRREPLPERDDGRPRVAHEDLREGTIVNGVVKVVGPFGVFLDIGATGDARLLAPARLSRQFRRGDLVRGLHVDWADGEMNRIQVSLEDAEQVVQALRDNPAPPPRRSEAGGGAAPAPGRRQAPQAAAARGRTAVEELRKGSVVNGNVSRVGAGGVFVDIGCVRDARLHVPPRLIPEFRPGDEVVGMIVERVNMDRGAIEVSIDDPSLSVAAGGEAQRPATAKRGNANKGAASQVKSSPPQRLEAPGAPPGRARGRRPRRLEDFSAGDAVDGVVSRVGQSVYVDVCDSQVGGRLVVPAHMVREFMAGDEVHGMRVDSIDLHHQALVLSLNDPRLAVDETGGTPAQQRGDARRPRPAQEAPGAGPMPHSRPAGSERSRGNMGHEWHNWDNWSGYDSGYGSDYGSSYGNSYGGGGYDRSYGSGKRGWSYGGWSGYDSSALAGWKEGQEVSGVVTRVSPSEGVFLDFGARREGRLRLSREDARKFRVDDEVQGMLIASVDHDREEVELELTFSLDAGPYEIPWEPQAWQPWRGR